MYKHLPLPIRFAKPHKYALYVVFTLLWLSGALWLGFHYFLRQPGDFGEIAHPLEIWWLRLHGLMGFAMLVAVGTVLPIHTRRAWHLHKNRSSGFLMQAILLLLALTGYALYYFASDANAAWLPLLHWIVGLTLPLMLVVHIRRGRARSQTVFKSVSDPDTYLNLPTGATGDAHHAFIQRQR
ncbi:MAG: hypothetical protein ACYCZH_01410 [Sulfuriferula sp.]